MADEKLLIEAWRQLPEHRQQAVIDFAQFLAQRHHSEYSPPDVCPESATLGEKLQSIRDRIVASGMPLLTPEEVEQEVLERRGGYQESQEMRLAAAVKWYEIGTVSQSKAAEIAGISRQAFLDALIRFEVSPFQSTENELEAEVNRG